MAWIIAKWDGKCKECKEPIYEGENAWYEGEGIYCNECGKQMENE